MFDYRLIEAMAMVVQEGGFEKAARKIHITQSAVSQRLRQLEEQMGQVLLTRTTPPRATPAGLKLIKHYLQVRHLENELAANSDDSGGEGISTLAVGINADSLATWFPKVLETFTQKEHVMIDIRVDDQEQTHQFLKDGDVIGCISTRETPMQGCRMDYIGQMTYRMVARSDFTKKWFADGITAAAVCQAPAIIFNRKDFLHYKLLDQLMGQAPAALPVHYIPSAEKFADCIACGIGYGMLPDQQSAPLIRSGKVIDLAPGCSVQVKLYWHCWNLKSSLLDQFSKALILAGRKLLEK